MLAKFDAFMTGAGRWIGVVFSGLAIYIAGPFPLVGQGERLGLAVGLAVVITLLTNPLAKKYHGAPGAVRALLWMVDLVLLVGFLFTLNRFLTTYESFWEGVVILETPELLVGLFGTLVVVEMVRRNFGPILPVICILAIVYAMYGNNLPGIFSHGGFSFEETMIAVWFSFDGVFTRPTDIVSSIVLVFIVFGAVLEATGASAILLKIAIALTARIRGGTAHSAIVASALFGMISGSPVANVVGTGVFTIPMIKRQGFRSSFAGGVEAAASSGGQFTPPIMGAVAFIMADFVGKPYLIVAIAAAIPALFYYFSPFASVYAEAVSLGIEPLPKDQRPVLTGDDWIESLRFVVPVVVVVAVLIGGRSAAMAGFFAILAAITVAIVIDVAFPSKRGQLKRYPLELLGALKKGGVSCAQIMVAVASIGIVIASVSLTGVALEFASQVTQVAEGSLFLALLISMLACIVLGMGLPTIPAYLFIVLFVGPVVGKLGVELILVHLFVLYYGVLSNVTPPVAIAAYAAAPIAGSNPMATAFQALKISAVGFLIPFVLIYNPSLSLVVGFEWLPFLWILARLPVSVWLIATAFIGCDADRLSVAERVLRAVLGIAVLFNETAVQIAAFVLGAGIVSYTRIRHVRGRTTPVIAPSLPTTDTGE